MQTLVLQVQLDRIQNPALIRPPGVLEVECLERHGRFSGELFTLLRE